MEEDPEFPPKEEYERDESGGFNSVTAGIYPLLHLHTVRG